MNILGKGPKRKTLRVLKCPADEFKNLNYSLFHHSDFWKVKMFSFLGKALYFKALGTSVVGQVYEKSKFDELDKISFHFIWILVCTKINKCQSSHFNSLFPKFILQIMSITP